MSTLYAAMERFSTIKQEHQDAMQCSPSGRPMSASDVATLQAIFGTTGLSGAEIYEQGARIVDAMMRDIARAGVLRSAKRAELRAVLFTAWVDGLGVGTSMTTTQQQRGNVRPMPDQH